jgi:hypothetical protein
LHEEMLIEVRLLLTMLRMSVVNEEKRRGRGRRRGEEEGDRLLSSVEHLPRDVTLVARQGKVPRPLVPEP